MVSKVSSLVNAWYQDWWNRRKLKQMKLWVDIICGED